MAVGDKKPVVMEGDIGKTGGPAALVHASRHASGGDDPITPDMIGAAPAGYGLGQYLPTYDDPDAIGLLQSGFFAFYNSTDTIEGCAGGIILNLKGNERTVSACSRQFFFPTHTNCYLLREYRTSWTDWEWVNPPMTLGVEYRTTERVVGKSIYRKGFFLGTIIANTDTVIDLGITDYAGCTEIQVTTNDKNITNDTLLNYVDMSGSGIAISVSQTIDVVVYLRYVKSTG